MIDHSTFERYQSQLDLSWIELECVELNQPPWCVECLQSFFAWVPVLKCRKWQQTVFLICCATSTTDVYVVCDVFEICLNYCCKLQVYGQVLRCTHCSSIVVRVVFAAVELYWTLNTKLSSASFIPNQQRMEFIPAILWQSSDEWVYPKRIRNNK